MDLLTREVQRAAAKRSSLQSREFALLEYLCAIPVARSPRP